MEPANPEGLLRVLLVEEGGPGLGSSRVREAEKEGSCPGLRPPGGPGVNRLKGALFFQGSGVSSLALSVI
jgi:hypothetical protein